MQIFADDLTGFVRNERSFNRFLDTIEEFGDCSGLRINYDKTEILFLGNQLPKHVNDETEIRKAKVKRAVKILGVQFTMMLPLGKSLISMKSCTLKSLSCGGGETSLSSAEFKLLKPL